MIQRYSLQEVAAYQRELKAIELECQGWSPDTDTGKQYRAIAHVMREVLLRMHESLEKNGAWRPSLFSRMFAAREIRKGVVSITGDQLGQLKLPKGGILASTPTFTPDPYQTVLDSRGKSYSKNVSVDESGHIHPRPAKGADPK